MLCFDDTMDEDPEQPDAEVEEDADLVWFREHVIEGINAKKQGSIAVDTSQRDLAYVDKGLTELKGKRKQAEKLNNQLSKMEDLSESVVEQQKLLGHQISLESFLKSETEICEADGKNEDLQRDTRGNLVLPDAVNQAMRDLGRKVMC